MVLTAFAVLVGIVTLLLALGAFFGLRELRTVRRDFRANLEASKTALNDATALVERWQAEADNVGARLETFVEAAYVFSRGEEAYRAGDYQRAADSFERTLELQPQNVRALYRLGRAYTNSDDVVRAENAFNLLLQAQPQSSEAYRGRALNIRYENLEEAMEYANKAIALDSNDPRNWNCLGLLMRDGGDIDGSLRCHLRADALGPANRITTFYLGLLEANKQRPEQAKQSLAVAVRGLEADEALGRVKPLWAAVVRWGNCVLNGEYDEADVHAREAASGVIGSGRRAREVAGHFDFLLRALHREEYHARYVGVIE